jgi:hypothetical protein
MTGEATQISAMPSSLPPVRKVPATASPIGGSDNAESVRVVLSLSLVSGQVRPFSSCIATMARASPGPVAPISSTMLGVP